MYKIINVNAILRGGWYCEIRCGKECVHTTLIHDTRDQARTAAQQWVDEHPDPVVDIKPNLAI